MSNKPNVREKCGMQIIRTHKFSASEVRTARFTENEWASVGRSVLSSSGQERVDPKGPRQDVVSADCILPVDHPREK
jgi:hypothetical protein